MQKEAVIHSMPGDRLLEAHDTSSCPNNREVSKPPQTKRGTLSGPPLQVPLSRLPAPSPRNAPRGPAAP